MVLEDLTELRGLRTVPREEYGTLSDTNALPPDGPPLMVLIVAVVLIVVGGRVWRKRGWPRLFVGAAVMTAGSAVELPIESGAATNAFELRLSRPSSRRKLSRTGTPPAGCGRPARVPRSCTGERIPEDPPVQGVNFSPSSCCAPRVLSGPFPAYAGP